MSEPSVDTLTYQAVPGAVRRSLGERKGSRKRKIAVICGSAAGCLDAGASASRTRLSGPLSCQGTSPGFQPACGGPSLCALGKNWN